MKYELNIRFKVGDIVWLALENIPLKKAKVESIEGHYVFLPNVNQVRCNTIYFCKFLEGGGCRVRDVAMYSTKKEARLRLKQIEDAKGNYRETVFLIENRLVLTDDGTEYEDCVTLKPIDKES